MKLPRDLSGSELVKALRALGYERVRQDGSHIRLTTQHGGQHHVTVPNHSPIKLGTLTGILKASLRQTHRRPRRRLRPEPALHLAEEPRDAYGNDGIGGCAGALHYRWRGRRPVALFAS